MSRAPNPKRFVVALYAGFIPRLTPLPTAAPRRAPMAPRTRAASAAAAEATCLLLDLSHDKVSIVTHELCDPLRPLLAVHLSSTAKGLREAMEEQLAELKQQRQGAAALAALWGWSCAQLRAATYLYLGAAFGKSLTLAHWRTLGTLARCGSLPRLQDLGVCERVWRQT